jgi:hypothetical protein
MYSTFYRIVLEDAFIGELGIGLRDSYCFSGHAVIDVRSSVAAEECVPSPWELSTLLCLSTPMPKAVSPYSPSAPITEHG